MIKIEKITKKYDNKITAVNEISFDISENEVFGLLGPNGAGKTTLIHILATLLKPTSGKATVNGYDISSQSGKVRSSIGIVFQAPSSDDMMTAYENLKIHSLLYNVDHSIREKRIFEVLELVGLTDRKNDLIKKYSGGMRRRLEIARGLLHKPKVLFLDEPTLGLDPNSREIMWNYIEKLVKEEKITIILTTHYMEEADKLCNRIGFINKGKLMALDSPLRLKSLMGGDNVKIFLNHRQKNNLTMLKSELIEKFEFINEVEIINDSTININLDNINRNLPVLLKNLNDVISLEFSKTTLNDVFKILSEGNEIDTPEGGFMERYAQYNNNN